MIIWLLVGLISYFWLKKLVFNTMYKDPYSYRDGFETLLTAEDWTNAKAIGSIIVCMLGGFLTLIGAIICKLVFTFNSNYKSKTGQDSWFNKKSKL